MKYSILNRDRKTIANDVEALIGERPMLNRKTRAFLLHSITFEEDGTVTMGDSADRHLLYRLIQAGFIQATPELDEWNNNQENGIDVHDNHFDQGIDLQESKNHVEKMIAEVPEIPDERDSIDDNEWENDEDYEKRYECLIEKQPEMVAPVISFPLRMHRAGSICNLVNVIYSKGPLISKATGGFFSATIELADRLQSEQYSNRIERIIDIIHEAGKSELSGISFDSSCVLFIGFPPTDNQDRIDAWTELAKAINRASIRQIHIQPRQTDMTNEKYVFRGWLIRIGMNGAETKAARKILYENLSGHTAFRTSEDAEKWTRRRNEIRVALQMDSAVRMVENGQMDAEVGLDGIRLKLKRVSLELTQGEVANLAGISLRQYRDYELGNQKIRMEPFHIVCRVLKALEINISDFAYGSRNERKVYRGGSP